MTVNQLRQLALRLGANQELFVRRRLKKPEIPEEKAWADVLVADADLGSDLARERQIARRLFWERELGMDADWGKGEPPGCFEQGNCK